MAEPIRPGAGAPPESIHIEKNKPNYLAWLALLLGLLALLWYLFGRHRPEPLTTATTTTTTTAAAPMAATAATTAAPSARFTEGVRGYLGGTDALPRTFTFDNLNFATASAAIRAEDRSEIDQLAQVLSQYPNSRVRVVGYTDAMGDAAKNVQLGADRAKAVAGALTAKGVAASRIETASGGENAPVDSNVTAGGRAENRRTELVVLSR